jgi:hypothetical protein
MSMDVFTCEQRLLKVCRSLPSWPISHLRETADLHVLADAIEALQEADAEKKLEEE